MFDRALSPIRTRRTRRTLFVWVRHPDSPDPVDCFIESGSTVARRPDSG